MSDLREEILSCNFIRIYVTLTQFRGWRLALNSRKISHPSEEQDPVKKIIPERCQVSERHRLAYRNADGYTPDKQGCAAQPNSPSPLMVSISADGLARPIFNACVKRRRRRRFLFILGASSSLSSDDGQKRCFRIATSTAKQSSTL